MKKLLVDTSLLIDFLRIKNKKESTFYKLLENNYDLNISMITHTELYAGKSVWEKRKRQEELEDLFSNIAILPFDRNISKKSGEIRAKYNLNLFDSIIAATAILNNLELVTLNLKDFRKIKSLKLYVKNINSLYGYSTR